MKPINYDMNAIVIGISGGTPYRFSAEYKRKVEAEERILSEIVAKQKAMSPEELEAQKVALEKKQAEIDWNTAINAANWCAFMRASGYDVPTPDLRPRSTSRKVPK